MGLHTAVLMEDVIVFLARPVVAGEVDEPVSPAIRIIDRERTDIASAISKRLEDQTLCGAQPVLVAHTAFERGKIGSGHAEEFELRGKQVWIGLAQEGQKRRNREGVEDFRGC